MTVKKGQRFEDVRAEDGTRVLEVDYVYRDVARDEQRVRCRVVRDTRPDVDSRASTTVALKRLLSPALFERVPQCTCDGWCKGRRYTCKGCGRFVPFCFGGAGDGPASEHCDDCWVKAQDAEAAGA